MDIRPITDEHYNRTSHGLHPLLQMKQGYNSATQFFSVTKGWKAKWRVKKYKRAKKSSNYHDYEKRERQKYQRAWPKSLKVISTPRPEKCPLRFSMTARAVGWACGHVTEMLLILWKKLFSTWLFEGKSLIWSSNFVRGQSVAETCFSYWG